MSFDPEQAPDPVYLLFVESGIDCRTPVGRYDEGPDLCVLPDRHLLHLGP